MLGSFCQERKVASGRCSRYSSIARCSALSATSPLSAPPADSGDNEWRAAWQGRQRSWSGCCLARKPVLLHPVLLLHPSPSILSFILHPHEHILASGQLFGSAVTIPSPVLSCILHPKLHPSSFILHPSSFILLELLSEGQCIAC